MCVLAFRVLCAVRYPNPGMLPNYFLEQGLLIALLKTWPTVTGLPKQPPAGQECVGWRGGLYQDLELLTGKPGSIPEPQTGL